MQLHHGTNGLMLGYAIALGPIQAVVVQQDMADVGPAADSFTNQLLRTVLTLLGHTESVLSIMPIVICKHIMDACRQIVGCCFALGALEEAPHAI